MHEEAVEEMKQTLEGVGLESLYRLGYTYGAAGRQDEARAVLGKIEEIAAERYVPSYYFAVVYTGLGEKDRAFEYLDKGFEERDMHLPWEVRDPVFDSLRVDPRWSTVLERLDLEPFDEDLLPVR
jgi:tetratricopeptide (TPR) repeat protein